MKNKETIELACPRCYSTFTYLVDECDLNKAICEYCGTKLIKAGDCYE